jgi:hypothetical protein
MTCPECDGERVVEVLACPNRGPWQECCAGHTREVECKRCGGSGEVEDDESEEAERG